MSIVEYIKEVVVDAIEKAEVEIESKPRFSIGDIAWKANTKSVEFDVPCPDCFGKRTLTVILGDESQVVIPCVGCKKRKDFNEFGCEDYSSGVVSRYRYEAVTEPIEIKGVERDSLNEGQFRYNSFIEDRLLFDNEAAAKARAAELAEEMARNEQMRFFSKEKPEKAWAWHVHYHRSCIRRAEQDLAWHKAKFEIAVGKKRAGNTE